MSSFARKQKRKCLQAKRKRSEAWHKGEKCAIKDNLHAYQTVCHATSKEIILYKVAKLEAATNLMVMIDVVMKKFGFGRKRIFALRKKINNHLQCIKTHYVTTEEIENILREEIKFDLQAKTEAKTDLQSRASQAAVRDISAAFCISLLDEFGWKQKRIGRAYRMLAAIGTLMKQRKIDMDELKAERNRKPKEQLTPATEIINKALNEAA